MMLYACTGHPAWEINYKHCTIQSICCLSICPVSSAGEKLHPAGHANIRQKPSRFFSRTVQKRVMQTATRHWERPRVHSIAGDRTLAYFTHRPSSVLVQPSASSSSVGELLTKTHPSLLTHTLTHTRLDFSRTYSNRRSSIFSSRFTSRRKVTHNGMSWAVVLGCASAGGGSGPTCASSGMSILLICQCFRDARDRD